MWLPASAPSFHRAAGCPQLRLSSCGGPARRCRQPMTHATARGARSHRDPTHGDSSAAGAPWPPRRSTPLGTPTPSGRAPCLWAGEPLFRGGWPHAPCNFLCHGSGLTISAIWPGESRGLRRDLGRAAATLDPTAYRCHSGQRHAPSTAAPAARLTPFPSCHTIICVRGA